MHPRTRILTPFSVVLVLFATACGGQPEQVVLPTQVVVEETTVPADAPPATADPAALPTLSPVTPSPTVPLPPQRGVAPATDEQQWVAVSAAGAQIPPQGFAPGDLYIVNAGGIVARLTTEAAVDDSPLWNIGGDQLFFVSDREGTPAIYTLNADDNTPVQRVAPFDEGDQRDPALSATTADLVFTTNRNGNDDLFVMSRDGRGLRPLIADPAPDYDADWSPDNTWIVFVSERDGNPELYLTDANGTAPIRLTDHPGVDHQPIFSPDGRSILFVSDRDNGVPQLFSMSLPQVTPEYGQGNIGAAFDVINGSIPPLQLDIEAPMPAPRQLTADPTPKESPSWYVNDLGGFRLTYTAVNTSPNGEQRQLFSAASDGSNVEAVGSLLLSFTDAQFRQS